MINIETADFKQNVSVVWCRRKVEPPNPRKFASFSATTVCLSLFFFLRAVNSNAARHSSVQTYVFPRVSAAISAALLSRSWLLTLKTAVTNVIPHLTTAILYRAVMSRGINNSHAVSMSGSISACSEREVAALCHAFLKMSKQSIPNSF
jgi:hypothetical protein